MKYFINFSNHPSDNWESLQKSEAEKYGPIIDIKFPEVDPNASEAEIKEMADRCTKEILSESPAAVMCQGEFSLTYAVVCRLKKEGIKVFTACSERLVVEGKGTKDEYLKQVRFKFVRFREYM